MPEPKDKQTDQKTRKRRLPLLRIAVLILCVLFASFLLKLTLVITAAPTICVSVDYMEEFNEFSRPPDSDPNENAAPYYEKAFNAFWELPAVARRPQYPHYPWPEDMNEIELGTAKKCLDLNSETLRYLEQATSKPYYWIALHSAPYPHSISDTFEALTPTPDLSKLRPVIYLLSRNAK